MAFLPDLLSRRAFALPEFELAPLEFAAEDMAELAELVLDQPIGSQAATSIVVPIGQPMATPGEMREKIESHLQLKGAAQSIPATASPAEELRLALAELRRSLG